MRPFVHGCFWQKRKKKRKRKKEEEGEEEKKQQESRSRRSHRNKVSLEGNEETDIKVGW